MRTTWLIAAAVFAGFPSPTARAHELWFRLHPEADRSLVRLSFGDTPAPGEAERVAEIARTKVWADGKPLEVKRLPDGLEVRLPDRRPVVLSAFADRGVVDFMGDSFVIELAAYAQTRPVAPDESTGLGLGDDQVRLLLVGRGQQPPVVRAVWKGKPVTDVAVEIFRDPAQKPIEVHTNNRGEIPCPDLNAGPVALLAQVKEMTPGQRDGRAYSHTRYKATLTLSAGAAEGSTVPSPDECLTRVKEVHGAAGPWAVAGYRMGERALKQLGLPRHSFSLRVVHRSPAEVRYSCVADGLQAATGASPGKLNLRLEEAPVDALRTTVEDRKTGRRLTFTLTPGFVRSVFDLSHDRLEAEGRRVAALPDDAIFRVTESK